jgi:hypothetical protein
MSAFAPLLAPKLTSSDRIINPSYERAPLYRQSVTMRLSSKNTGGPWMTQGSGD